MSPAISIGRFTKSFLFYLLASLVTYFATAFTIPAWLIYLFIFVPFYSACILYLINFNLKNRQQTIRYQRLPLWRSVIFQFLIILTSPASCNGYKQGEACYSFIQAQLTKDTLTSLQNTIPHWNIVESMFLVAVSLHVVYIVAFLRTVRIQEQ
jgi:hypothetical protein